ncbi:MAG: tetratricopeptide repeat protein [Nitrospira sp. SB0675_bin_23]|nr:tetratricopeptide repeat protein [Nitrospira sp. SB0667_bin_9]MYD30645.1 tetratricopeptide repeat protein [Nitrospira sp. SB0661_bin_20]MYH01075.1 tetratricopeptide repeat protein [Nitrospira sp. SB0675_bin_23]MYJ23443.1 tetratricopeptide repeat protein [Nitrospira sp. SB0673_bin_12]
MSALILILGVFLASVPAQAETETWKTLNTAGMLAYKERDFVLAKEMFHRALNALEGSTDPDSRTATTLNNLGATHEALDEYEQAELRYRHALTMIETIQGVEHPDVAVGLNNLASLYFSQQAFEKAEPLWQRGLSISEKFLGDAHPHLIQPLLTLGLVTQVQKKFDRAESYYLRAIAIGKRALGANHPSLISLYERYASFLRQAGRDEDALAVDRQVEDIRDANQRPSPPE